VNVEAKEKAKYERVWNEIPEYGNMSPAAEMMPCILSVLTKHDIHSILDAGSGSGKALEMLIDAGYTAKGIDITLDGLYAESLREHCIEASLWDIPLTDPFDVVMSIDVLEHIPPQMIDKTISELSRLCKKFAIFQVALFKDGFGKRINDTLHLSLFSADEWQAFIKKHFDDVKILEKLPGYVVFFCGKHQETVAR
jgi:SAM-dependent methyltransferase